MASVFMILLAGVLSACQGQKADALLLQLTPATPTPAAWLPTPMPTRPLYQPGELVDYTAQPGDTLPALAAHFNSTEKEIREANPVLPERVTTLPSGLPLKIPIYYQSLWGSPFQIMPDNLFVNGPSQVGFDTTEFVNQHPGWLKDHREYAGDKWRTGAEFVDFVATEFSISPRLLLAILEYQTHALSDPNGPPEGDYPLGYEEMYHKGLNNQLVWAANALNNGFYGWRAGSLRQFTRSDGTLEVPDPWQNAGTVALQYYFSQIMDHDSYLRAISSEGIQKTYAALFGDPWKAAANEIPGSLEQPALRLPFSAGSSWTYTGGPHTGWGSGEPLAALDFAPPNVVKGCQISAEWATAVSDGVVARSEPAIVVLDLDGDGDERTGWNIFYLHLASADQQFSGAKLKTGDPVGRPSCEGGDATGSHVHIARKYNGEWVPAGGPLAFDLENWIAHFGPAAYQGTLQKQEKVVTACVCSDKDSQITAGAR
jgi:murein DD-endopeptidase MepM/ murein hydrolase activator NlpD